jgi:predicted TIM-barrel enzyme
MIDLPERRFWPVIHTQNTEQAARNIKIASDAGAHGVFLINMDITIEALINIVQELRDADVLHIDLGLNLLGLSNDDAMMTAQSLDAAAYWTDHTEGRGRTDTGLSPEWFGGTAHKGNVHVGNLLLAMTARQAATRMSVPTTTGEGTGIAADPERVRLCRTGMTSDQRLGLASGLTPGNVDQYLPYVTDYLAATGISDSFYELNADLTDELADKIASAS